MWGKKNEIGNKNGKGEETEIGNAGESHSAVIQCDDDGFKSTVILALQSIL